MSGVFTSPRAGANGQFRRQRPPPPGPSRDSEIEGSEASDTFPHSIRAFVHVAESNVPAEYLISRLLTEFHFEKRRLYDVMCVFCVIGCCQKISMDLVRWEGMSRISQTFMTLQRNAGADSPDIALDGIIVPHTTVSISTLTVGFLLCFLALHQRTLDIKQISRYLSRNTGRNKSILCKLYQIAHILEAAGVMTRSDVPGQITIVEKFFALVDLNAAGDAAQPKNPFAIESILNRVRPGEEQILQTRLSDFLTNAGVHAAASSLQ
jgi:hypothetical protein